MNLPGRRPSILLRVELNSILSKYLTPVKLEIRGFPTRRISMQTLNLAIHSDEIYNFFLLFDNLSQKQKEIWKLITWWVKRYPNAHPLQSTIASKAKCSRKHVNRTLSLFKNHGWLALGWRGKCQSKTLLIPPSLQMMDVVNREYFARLEVTSKVTHSYSSHRDLTSRGTSEIPAGSFEKVEPSSWGIKCGYSRNGCLKMGLFSESTQQEALRICKGLGKFGWKPKNEERYYLGVLFKIAKSKGDKVNFRAYYAAGGS